MLKREELNRPLWILLGSLLLLLLVGSVWDRPLGEILLGDEKNVFVRVLAAFGELPAFLLFIAAGVAWFVRRGRSNRWLEWFSIFGSFCFIAGGAVLTFLSLLEDM